jgi:hypothetical protein
VEGEVREPVDSGAERLHSEARGVLGWYPEERVSKPVRAVALVD